jgi:hypothetical protein
MRNILLGSLAACMVIGVASAQNTKKPENPNMQTPPTQMHKDQAAKKNTEKAGAMPGTNVSGATSDKGKGTMPENPNAKKGTVSGTAGSGMAGSGANSSDSGSSNK